MTIYLYVRNHSYKVFSSPLPDFVIQAGFSPDSYREGVKKKIQKIPLFTLSPKGNNGIFYNLKDYLSDCGHTDYLLMFSKI